MAYYPSLYGGKQGRTYNIVAHYDSIYDMVMFFKKGGSYTDANYNEYVIIDTIVNKNEKNNPENGILYRRGLNYQEDFVLSGDATSIRKTDTITKTLVGEIGGEYTDITIPSTGSVVLSCVVPKYSHYKYVVNAADNIEITSTEDNGDFNKDWLAFVSNPGGGAEYVGQIIGPQGESPWIKIKGWSDFNESFEEHELETVKGKGVLDDTKGKVTDDDGNIIYNDDIRYGYLTMRDDSDNIVGAYFGIDIPKTVYEFSASSASPYGPTIIWYPGRPESAAAVNGYFYLNIDDGTYSVLNADGKFEDYTEKLPNDPVIVKYTLNRPNEGEDGVYYYDWQENKYYLYDKTNQEITLVGETKTYNTVPKYVEENPWTALKGTITSEWAYDNLIREKGESRKHNYYKSFDIKLPHGLHGEDIEEMGMHIEDNDGNTAAQLDAARDENGNLIRGNARNNFSVYYKTRNYDSTEQGAVSEEKHIGWFNVIDRITANDQSHPGLNTLARDTTYAEGDMVGDDRLALGYGLTAVSSGTSAAQLDVDFSALEEGDIVQDGSVVWKVCIINTTPADKLIIHYTYNDDDTITIRLLDELSIDDDGRMYAKYTDLNHRIYLDDFKKIKEVKFDDRVLDNGVYINRFYIVYNTYNRDLAGEIVINDRFVTNGTNIISYPTTDSEGHNIEYIDNAMVKWVTNVVTDSNTGNIVCYYNDGTSNSLGILRSIRQVFFDENYNLVIEWSTMTNGVAYDRTTLNNYTNKTIHKVWLNNDGNIDASQTWMADYVIGQEIDKNGNKISDKISTGVDISDPIDYIAGIKLYGDNLVILHADPAIREALTNYYMLPCDDGNIRRWENLGPIFGDSPHIMGNFDSYDDLKEQYPNGFGSDSTTKNRAGWIATVKNSEDNSYELYAFDYINPTNGWYKIHTFSEDDINPQLSLLISAAAANNENRPPVDKDKLNVGGYWFVVEDK